jgi:hypothetical protein
MSIFNIFGRKDHQTDVSGNVLEIASPNAATNEEPVLPASEPTIENEKKEKKENGDGSKYITITWGTGQPIDVIFSFIHKNREEEGYQDALINSDLSYMKAKEEIIRNELKMLFKRISIRYKDNILVLDVQKAKAEAAFISSSVAILQARREIYVEHLAQIEEMEKMLDADDPKMTTMIETYRRGFNKGIAAQTAAFINSENH